MPMWQIYHPAHALSAEEKQAIARKITTMYESFLPRFYVNVFFHSMPPGSVYLGGEPTEDFVRVTIDHIARAMKDDAVQQQFLVGCTRVLQPYIAAHGLRWELHVDETPFSLWTIEGLKPPLPGTAAGEKWRSENRPSAWE
ncbi:MULTISPECIES: tautomerase family protein [Serratia]|nr:MULTISPECIES: tautomerase family protein [Serratia]MBH2656340.1 tautomerase family protein [Serratia ureilytica]MBH2884148.1 tautomerase family protein [Serratia ureilytica]MBH2925228.1 tautomerase family protein [Serratia ureilytica]MDP8635065.1 tautomerase family protein [Serratia marcescens]MDP8868566.1 tautomerase family protein [Serratia marcescens]